MLLFDLHRTTVLGVTGLLDCIWTNIMLHENFKNCAIYKICSILFKINLYITASPDVMTYVISALICDTYVEPAANASNLILYPLLFEEIKTIL